MTLKPEKYRHHFDGLGLTDAQCIALCEAICMVAELFADRAFGPPTAPPGRAANDNDSVAKNTVVKLFQQAANIEPKEHSASAGKPGRTRP
jgi:hypothetical protein